MLTEHASASLLSRKRKQNKMAKTRFQDLRRATRSVSEVLVWVGCSRLEAQGRRSGDFKAGVRSFIAGHCRPRSSRSL